jgi:hypothetical protein
MDAHSEILKKRKKIAAAEAARIGIEFSRLWRHIRTWYCAP